MMKNHLRMVMAGLLLLVSGAFAFAQNKVTGTVKDANGEPIVAASVVVRGTTIGAVTDLDGNYTLNCSYPRSYSALQKVKCSFRSCH